MNIRQKILTGGIIFALTLTFVLSYDTYKRFSTIIMRDYEATALETAQTALTFLDVDNFSSYNQDKIKLQKLLDEWQKITDTQGAMFIYVIEPFNNYENIRFNMKVTHADSLYDVVLMGEERQTSSNEYKAVYRSLYNGEKNYDFVIRENGVSNVGDHITALVPIKNSAGAVESILCVQLQMDRLDAEKIFFLKHTSQTVFVYLVMLIFIGRQYINLKLLKPLSELTDGVKEISGGNLNKKLEIKTGDELQTLAENFNTMTDELKSQMNNLEKVTAEKERIATELDVATKIQSSMLPKDFSIDKRAEIFATMKAAKEVGGDLYDFYKIDEDNLFITIADVSGKGVPAALFMVAAITNLRNFVASLKSPEDLKTAIENTGNKLCANNDGELFVTAFCGVLNLTTGKFIYVNAGHNPPLIRRNGKNFEPLPMELNFVLGGWEDWQYIQQEIQLAQGDTIFLYTDGVTEAVNSAGKMYSFEYLQQFLNELDKNSAAEKILEEVHKSLQNFSKGAEQADDITMLAVKFEGRNENVN